MTAKLIRFDEEYASKLEEFVATSNGHIEIVDDPNLQMDPYYYERCEQIAKTIEDTESGKMKTIPHDEFWEEMELYTQELEQKYAN